MPPKRTTADPTSQLDIFADSRDVMLRNDVLDALTRHDAATARTAWHALAGAYPGDADLAPLDVLIRALDAQRNEPLPDHDALAQARHTLTGGVAAAARQALGAAAAEAWLRPKWRQLAARSQALPFVASRADDHAAAVWLRAESWREATVAVQSIESWRRIPAPLGWMAEARCRLGELDDTWPLIAELAWLAPARLEALLQRRTDPLLARLHRQFIDHFDGSGDAADLPWFPAWVLTQSPALAPRLAEAWPSQHSQAERGLRLMVELLGLERQGRHHELVQRRRALRDLHEPLSAAYMATR